MISNLPPTPGPLVILSDEEVRERLCLLQRWAAEMDKTIATLKAQRENLAQSIKRLQDALDRNEWLT